QRSRHLGKIPAPVSVEKSIHLGAASPLQEHSPALSDRNEITEVRPPHSKRNRVEEKRDPTTQHSISNEPGELFINPGIEVELKGSNYLQPGEQSRPKRSNRNKKMDGQPGQVISSSAAPPLSHSRMSENSKLTNSTPDDAPPVDEPVDRLVSQWLKSLLPEVSGGWWDVYPKDNGFAVKFRWRDRGRQTLSFPRISKRELQDLRKCSSDESRKIMRERISISLHRLSLDPDKHDKSLLVARKLGFEL
ncbi:MAG: hypothetical protein L0220_28510, partial [Acidobacteria bacterium]|nr:hypothetical protein [Acidobacteriota bacterium]